MSRELPPLEKIKMSEEDFRRLNRRRFLTWAALSGTGVLGFYFLKNAADDRGLPWPLRQTLNAGDALWKNRFNVEGRASATQITNVPLRINSDIGIQKDLDLNSWKLEVISPQEKIAKTFSLEQIKSLPVATESFEFKCVEGWSQDVTCKGVRFSDFMNELNVGWRAADAGGDTSAFNYALLTTPNKEYYVSMDIESLMHPQTLLCYEINGAPLGPEHGEPLRLITSVKYGVKCIKQIGLIAFSDSPPADYWAENGYSEYLGL